MTLRVQIIATGLRGAGKTYILNRLADELRQIQEELPGREIQIVLTEEHVFVPPQRKSTLPASVQAAIKEAIERK